MLNLQCPKCHNNMKYLPTSRGRLDKKVKRCVYCGRSFKVKQNIKSIV